MMPGYREVRPVQCEGVRDAMVHYSQQSLGCSAKSDWARPRLAELIRGERRKSLFAPRKVAGHVRVVRNWSAGVTHFSRSEKRRSPLGFRNRRWGGVGRIGKSEFRDVSLSSTSSIIPGPSRPACRQVGSLSTSGTTAPEIQKMILSITRCRTGDPRHRRGRGRCSPIRSSVSRWPRGTRGHPDGLLAGPSPLPARR